MLITEKFAKLSSRKKAWLILAIITIFTVGVVLADAGNYYNRLSRDLASRTNNVIVLPEVKELPFNLGLDLQGGSHLVYKADVANIAEGDRGNALEAVRDVIERRVNAFGVSEPIVQTNRGVDGEYQIVVELAGIKNVEEAIKMIGETPILEFKEEGESEVKTINATGTEAVVDLGEASAWKNTELTGKYLKRANIEFNQNDGSPEVSLEFNDEGSKLFEEITARNIGRPVAIFLDGYPISIPTVQDKITGGKASISGKFNVDEAKLLVKRLNSGALPVAISLISQKTVEASLGAKAIDNSLTAGLFGLLLVSLFMIAYYRLPGLLSVISLLVYGSSVLAMFKSLPVWLAVVMVAFIISLIFYTFNEMKIFSGSLAMLFSLIGLLLFFYAINSVTLSLSGIAGLILSIGMAVDANILIFSRMREELKAGKSVHQAVDDGFRRAWPSIREGNISSIITCFILMFFGTSAVQGFGTTLFIGIAISLFSAIVVTRTLSIIVLGQWLEKKSWLVGPKMKSDSAK